LAAAGSPWSRAQLPAKTILGRLAVSFLLEFVHFLRTRKKYWLIPIILVMALFGGLVVLSQGTAIAPFIYTLF
jgi:NAD/NADP transhydrogenase beta subunit